MRFRSAKVSPIMVLASWMNCYRAHLHSLGEGQADDVDAFVVVEVLGGLGETGREVNVHLLGEKTRRDIEGVKLRPSGGGAADLFLKLADGSGARLLAFSSVPAGISSR